MINPSDIKIGELKRCINTKYIRHLDVNGKRVEFSCAIKKESFEPIIGTKTLIKIDAEEDFYVDLSEINSNKDLRNIRRSITDNGLILDKKVLTCFSGKIRVCRETLHSHPYFEDSSITKPINIKKLKKYLKV